MSVALASGENDRWDESSRQPGVKPLDDAPPLELLGVNGVVAFFSRGVHSSRST